MDRLQAVRPEGARQVRAPGLHFFDVTRERPEQNRPQHGIPLFVGFGTPSAASPGADRGGLAIDRWEQFQVWVDAAPDGYLAEAVRGFFVNGGARCRVLAVGPTARDLIEPFEQQGMAEDIAETDLVCVPDAVNPLCENPADVQFAVVRHCDDMADRFAILDVPLEDRARTKDSGRTYAEFLHSLTPPLSRLAAFYYPGLLVEEPPRTGGPVRRAPRLVPPCGHVAGIYARSDARFGIHKAPANEIVEGTLKLQHAVGEFDQAGLNAAGFNAIRSVPGRGIRVMGARTLSRSTAWQYVPVVRLFVALTRWLNGQMGQIVFEPHTPDLRQQVQRRIASHCAEMMQAGMLASDDPDEAYFVKCDAEINPPESVEAGRLVVHIGLAPSVPAEFVEVRITHDASGIAVTGT